MGLSVREQIQQRKEKQNEVVEKKNRVSAPVPENRIESFDPESGVGTQGNYIEPIDGEPITDQELAEKQFAADFGDTVDDSDIADLLDGEVERPLDIQQQDRKSSSHDVVTPDGKVISYKDPQKAVDDESSEEGSDDTEEEDEQVRKTVGGTSVEDSDQYVLKSEYDKLKKDFDKLHGKHSDIVGKLNNAEDIVNLKQDELLTLRRILHDMEKTPLGLIVADYYDGKLDTAKLMPAKPIRDFMPEGHEYDYEEAYNSPGSPSWNARVEWERDKEEGKRKIEAAGLSVKQRLEQEAAQPTKEDLKKQDEQLRDQLYKKIPVAKKLESEFDSYLKGISNIYFPLFASFYQSRKGKIQPPKKVVQKSERGGGGRPQHYVPTNADKELHEEFGD